MIYQFKTDDGRILEKAFPISQAPAIGQVIELDDPDTGRSVKARRIISRLGAVRGDNWRPYVSERLPRHLPGVRCTPEGKPIIESRQQERNIAAKFGYERE